MARRQAHGDAGVGVLLFTSEAIRCYYHVAFTVSRRVAAVDETRVRPIWNKFVAVVSVTLWSGVGVGGRWIGFS